MYTQAAPLFAAMRMLAGTLSTRLDYLKSRINDAYERLDQAEADQKRKHGRMPSQLIAWRYYSAIGESGIEDARDRFLKKRGRADPAQIEAEYIDAKKRYKATSRHITAWYKKGRPDIASQGMR